MNITKNLDTTPVIVENIFQKPVYSGKKSPDPEENPIIVENSQPAERIVETANIEPEFIPNPEEIQIKPAEKSKPFRIKGQ